MGAIVFIVKKPQVMKIFVTQAEMFIDKVMDYIFIRLCLTTFADFLPHCLNLSQKSQ